MPDPGGERERVQVHGHEEAARPHAGVARGVQRVHPELVGDERDEAGGLRHT